MTQGRLTTLRVYLNDGVTEATLASGGGGIEFDRIEVYPTAARAGTWNLWATGTDACGNVAQTGLIRRVTVNP